MTSKTMSFPTAGSIQINHRQVQLTESTDDCEEEIRISFQEAYPPACIDSETDKSSATNVKGTILLIHGFPQTSHQFRHVIPSLADAGYHIIAPDYRGHGSSSRPLLPSANSFTKRTLAADLHNLVTYHLRITTPIHLIGHDIGGMIAHAYATEYPSSVQTIIWGECPLPGSRIYESVKHSQDMWHFDFHSQRTEMAVALVTQSTDTVRLYLKDFYDRISQNAAAVNNTDALDFYVRQYSQPDAMRCAFLTYRAFETDAQQNRLSRDTHGKIRIPNLVLTGEKSIMTQDQALDMASEFYEHPQGASVKGVGHWIAEENPEGFVEEVLNFIQGEERLKDDVCR